MKHVKHLYYLMGSLFFPSRLYAAVSMPWDDSLQVIVRHLTGTTAYSLIVIAIALSGILLAFGEHGSFIQKAGRIIFGASIATGAVSIYSALKFGG